MNIFAWKFSLEEGKIIDQDLDYDFVKIWENSYFIMWADEDCTSSQDVVKKLESFIGKISSVDISIESEDQLEILLDECNEGAVYESVNFEWANVSFDDILQRFADNMEAVCVRETRVSKTFKNRIISVDFLY